MPLLDKDKQPVQTVPQAMEALNRLKVNRSDSNLPVLHRCPKFSDYVKTYLDFIRAGQDSGQAMKKAATIAREEGALKQWTEDLGGTRLDKIALRHINAHIAKRLQSGTNKRTVKIDIIVLNNLLNHAIEERWINTLPRLSKEAPEAAQERAAQSARCSPARTWRGFARQRWTRTRTAQPLPRTGCSSAITFGCWPTAERESKRHCGCAGRTWTLSASN